MDVFSQTFGLAGVEVPPTGAGVTVTETVSVSVQADNSATLKTKTNPKIINHNCIMKFVSNITNLTKDDTLAAGGKGALLGELSRKAGSTGPFSTVE